jgi:hypothetical protein
MGSQKLTRRQLRTPAVAARHATPKPVSTEMQGQLDHTEATGGEGMTARMLANP